MRLWCPPRAPDLARFNLGGCRSDRYSGPLRLLRGLLLALSFGRLTPRFHWRCHLQALVQHCADFRRDGVHVFTSTAGAALGEVNSNDADAIDERVPGGSIGVLEIET